AGTRHTGEGLKGAMAGTQVVIDLANSPSFEDKAVLEFFETSGRHLLAAEAAAGVGHHVALSIVGTDRTPENGYFRAKVAQEKLIEASGIPYTIIRSTQFLEFLRGIADEATERPDTLAVWSTTARSCRWAKRAWAASVSTNGVAAHRQEPDQRARCSVPTPAVMNSAVA